LTDFAGSLFARSHFSVYFSTKTFRFSAAAKIKDITLVPPILCVGI